MTPSNAFSFDPGSFRDRSGRVFHRGGAILRALDADAWQDWQTLSRTRFFRSFQDDGALIATEAVDGDGSMPTPAGGGGTPHHLSSVKRRVCKPAVIKRL